MKAKTPKTHSFRRLRPGRLGVRLAIAFAAVAALTIVVAGVLIGISWQRQFESYVLTGLRDRAASIASAAAPAYVQAGDWEHVSFAGLEHFGMMTGVRVQISDQSDRVIVDTAYSTTTLPTVRPKLATMDEPVAVSRVIVNGHVVGKVRVSSLSPGLLSERDVRFRRSSIVGLLIAAVIAVCFATIAGALYARVIVRPIDAVTRTAAALRSGEREARTGMRGEDAISMLGRTFDEMADSIEADREFERRLTADVAHELRTPLQAIQATVEAMQDGVLPADSERLGVVRDETVRLARLANSILELSRLERGSLPMRREALDLALPVSAALDIHRALLESSGLTVTEHVAEDVRVLGDADRLTQAVGNLLANAARYTESGGEVTVRLFSEGGDGVVEVEDTGIGIAEEHFDKIFTRFWRADPSRERSKGGVGIGLAIVKEIVDRHAGRIAVRSREGVGTTFTIRLPLDPAAQGAPERPAAEAKRRSA